MITLMTTILSSIALIQEGPAVLAAVLCVFCICLAATGRREDRPVALDRHTLADIGYAPGSISWLR